MDSAENHIPYKNDLKYAKVFVNHILEETLEKTKISLLMPRFLKDVDIVFKRLKNTEFDKCARMLRAYIQDEKADIKKCRSGTLSQYQEQSLIRLIDLFQENYKILNYFPDWLQELTPIEHKSLGTLVLIKSTTRDHFKEEAIKQLKQEEELDVIYRERKQIMNGLSNMNQIRIKNRPSLRWAVAVRSTALTSLEGHISTEIVKARKVREETMIQCVLRGNPRKFLDREKEAEQKLEFAATSCEKAHVSNLERENQARAERNKVIIQYQALLKKYDEQMSLKFQEQIYLDKEYNELLARHEEFIKRIYQPAEQIYDNIITARLLEQEEIRQAKIREFTVNRAARVIQLAYRAYLRIHKPELVPPENPRKGKKGKKKATDKARKSKKQ